jgi:HAD superfamily hydrolase (TIGR01509 family)
MISAILFDLDGTIITSTKHIHREALEISLSAHGANLNTSHFEALSTKQKLAKINEEFRAAGVPEIDELSVNTIKQRISRLVLENMSLYDGSIRDTLSHLHRDYLIGCCTNSTRDTLNLILDKMALLDLFDVTLSNEDAAPKPSPDIYLKAMKILEVDPSEVLIVEDSDVGLEAAEKSGAEIFRVSGPKDITISSIVLKIDSIKHLETTK